MTLKKFIPFAFAGIALFGLASCQNDDEPQAPVQEEQSTEMTPLAEVLVNVVDSHNGTDGDSYILYDASTNEYTTISAEDYALLNAFADVIVRDDNPMSRAPQGNGWVQGGSGKGRSGAMKVAMKLANKLEKQRDFEIHVEYADDGSFTVWYRYV
jgi:hypothetical protein